ncbi:MAG: lysoplasmalogenase [Actinomycetes bacterium]
MAPHPRQLAARRPATAYLALAAADTVLAATGRPRLRWATKPLLMPTLMPGRDRATQRALALSGAGDVALLGTGQAAFTAGLGCFLGGHLAWIAALRTRPSRRLLRGNPALALPYVGAWAGLNAYLWPRTGRDRIPVLAYSTVLLAMALTALDSGEPAAVGGGALFLASDALLALERFGDVHLPGHEGWVMASYTAAQALLAAGSQP